MKITDKAKVLINKALSEEGANAIRLHTSRSCCGTSLRFERKRQISHRLIQRSI